MTSMSSISIAGSAVTALLLPILTAQDPGHEGHGHEGHTHAPVQGPVNPQGPAPQAGGQQVDPGPNDWFEATRRDLGTYFDDEVAVGKFLFHNPREAEHQLSNIQPNCACTKAIIRVGDRTYEIGADKLLYRVESVDGAEQREQVRHINVGSEEKGEVEVHMTMHGVRGRKDALVSLQTSDEELPLVNLQWQATGAQYFVVEPPDVNLNEMAWGDKREFEFRISSPMQQDFNLLSHEELSKGMRIEYEKEMRDDRAVWHVRGTYGPEVDEADGGGLIQFATDVDGKAVSARVIAMIKGPLTLKPGGFVSLGHIKSDEGKTAEVVLSPSGDFDLQVEKLEVVRLHGIKPPDKEAVRFTHEKDGRDIVVHIEVDKGVQAGTYMNGLLRIHLNHPASRLKEVMFNGFVR